MAIAQEILITATDNISTTVLATTPVAISGIIIKLLAKAQPVLGVRVFLILQHVLARAAALGFIIIAAAKIIVTQMELAQETINAPVIQDMPGAVANMATVLLVVVAERRKTTDPVSVAPVMRAMVVSTAIA